MSVYFCCLMPLALSLVLVQLRSARNVIILQSVASSTAHIFPLSVTRHFWLLPSIPAMVCLSMSPAYLVWWVRLDQDPAYSAYGFSQRMASLVLWFGLDDWWLARLTKFEGELNLLLEADDDTVIWLESTASAALAKWTSLFSFSGLQTTYEDLPLLIVLPMTVKYPGSD